MAQKKIEKVTMRIRVGESELEVTGPANFVEKKIAEFIELNKTTPLGQHAIRHPASQPIAAEAPIQRRRIAPAHFFRKSSARTDVDRTLLAGYYLEKYENCEMFTAADVKTTIRSAKITPPANTNNLINANIRKGLMMAAGDKDNRRAFVLTSDGEDTIKEMLQE